MAVVTYYGRSYKDPNSILLPEPAQAEGRPRGIVTGPIALANGDSAASKIFFGKIPSHAIPDPSSVLYHGAHTTLNSFDIGLYKDGAVVNVNVFAAALDITSAGTKNPFAAITTPNTGKRVWELLGLARDPGVEYDVVGTMNAGTTAAATMSLIMKYFKK